MFTLQHFIWLGIAISLIVTALILLKKYNVSPKIVGKVAMIIAIAGKLFHLFLSIKDTGDGGVILQSQLDFHLCSIQVYLLIACHLMKDENKINSVKSFMAPTMAIGAFLALIIPTEGADFAKPRVWQYMIVHTNLMFYGLYLMIVEKVDLSKKAYVRNLISLSGLAMVALMMNSILESYDTNFLFLRNPPMENLPILNLNNGYLVYLLSLILIAITIFTAVHLPFMLKKSKK